MAFYCFCPTNFYYLAVYPATMCTVKMYLFLLFLLTTGCTAPGKRFFKEQEDRYRGLGITVLWGKEAGTFEKEHIQKLAARKLGFDFDAMIDSTAGKVQRNYVDRHNRKVNRILHKRIGSNWRQQFEQEADRFSIVYRNSYERIRNNQPIWNRASRLADSLKYERLYFFLAETAVKDSFMMRYAIANGNTEPGKILFSVAIVLPGYELKVVD